MRFPVKITSSCIWVAIPVDWVILHWYACGVDGRSGGLCTVTSLPNFLGWVVYCAFSYPWCSTCESSAINLVFVWRAVCQKHTLTVDNDCTSCGHQSTCLLSFFDIFSDFLNQHTAYLHAKALNWCQYLSPFNRTNLYQTWIMAKSGTTSNIVRST